MGSAIVDGEPPDLPEEGYSATARDFVHGCLNKIPKLRPTYSMLLAHPWLAGLSKPLTISEEEEVAEWVKNAMERKKRGLMGEAAKPALHAAPLDTVSPAATPEAWSRLACSSTFLVDILYLPLHRRHRTPLRSIRRLSFDPFLPNETLHSVFSFVAWGRTGWKDDDDY